MSAASKETGNWFSQNYDKLTLVVALILLLASSVYLLLIISNERNEIEDADFITRGVVEQPAVPVDINAYQSNLVESTRPFDSAMITSNRLVTSEERVSCVNPECLRPIAYHASACPWCQKAQPDADEIDKLDRDQDGIPDVMETEMGLDMFDPNDALEDPDGDAFTNVEEYRFGSDANDAESTPPPVTKLRIAKVLRKPVGFLFNSVLDRGGENAFQVNSLSERNRSYFLSIGDTILDFTLEAHDPDTETLTLRRGEKVVELKIGKPGGINEYEVKLVSLLDGRTYPQGRTETLKLESELEVGGYSYKVIDINGRAVLIQDINSGDEISVARYTQAEMEDFRYRMQNRRPEPRRP